MICVVGSGPSAAACVAALIAQGIRPVVLDVGMKIEKEVGDRISTIGQKSPDAWSEEDRAAIRGNVVATASGIPLKLLFGSNFIYRSPEGSEMDLREVGILPSSALGGLSNVWGAAMLSHREEDLADWPAEARRLDPHYRAVAALTGLTGDHDRLEAEFPLFSTELDPVNLSSQGHQLLEGLERHSEALKDRGVIFGRARLALRSREDRGLGGCRHCGMCMYGCPYEIIFNSADTFREWIREDKIDYRRGMVVRRFEERDGVAVVEGWNRETQEPFRLEFTRVFMAAGVLNTAHIALDSLQYFDRPVRALDSQYFVVPFLTFRGAAAAEAERSVNTLSQLFVELLRVPHLQRPVHLQVYGYNDLIGNVVRSKFGPMAKLATPVIRKILRHLMVVQGYLHSDESSGLELRLEKHGAKSVLRVRPAHNPETRSNVKRILRFMEANARQLGGVPLAPMLSVGEPGRGFHTGGVFPMSADPAGLQTDVLGRLKGFERVHLVDGSVLPSIPATTVTFSTMANAHRIAASASHFG